MPFGKGDWLKLCFEIRGLFDPRFLQIVAWILKYIKTVFWTCLFKIRLIDLETVWRFSSAVFFIEKKDICCYVWKQQWEYFSLKYFVGAYKSLLEGFKWETVVCVTVSIILLVSLLNPWVNLVIFLGYSLSRWNWTFFEKLKIWHKCNRFFLFSWRVYYKNQSVLKQYRKYLFLVSNKCSKDNTLRQCSSNLIVDFKQMYA